MNLAMPQQATDHRRAIAERNVESILDAAEAILRRGTPLTVSAVAAEAGVSRVTFYAHFPDRIDLLEAVVERAVRRWIAATERVEPDRGPPEEALRRLIEVGWEEISRSSHIAAAASAELDAAGMRRSHETGRDLIRALVERGRREGAFRTDVDAEWLMVAFFSLIHGAHDEVRAGRLDSHAALAALSVSVPDLFRGCR